MVALLMTVNRMTRASEVSYSAYYNQSRRDVMHEIAAVGVVCALDSARNCVLRLLGLPSLQRVLPDGKWTSFVPPGPFSKRASVECKALSLDNDDVK